LSAAFFAVLAAWAAAWVAASERRANCNPDDLTGCDTLGSVLLWVVLGLPVVLVALLILLVLDILALKGRRSRSRKDQRDG
jgi:hypothetical protein